MLISEARKFLQTEAGRRWLELHPPIAGGSPAVPSGAAGQAAVQTLTSTATGGSFKVVVDGTPTAALTCTTATGAQVQSAIQAALGQSTGSPPVAVSGAAGGPWTLTIPPQLVNQLNANTPLTVDNSLATGGTVVAAVTTQGLAGGSELSGSGQATSEAPRVVGAAGQPALAAGWTSVAGVSTALTVPGVAAARTDWEPLQFYQDADGFVHIEGVVAWGAAAAPLIFTLPAGYRPFQTHDVGPNVEVRPDGTVSYMGSTASGGALDIGDVSFRATGV